MMNENSGHDTTIMCVASQWLTWVMDSCCWFEPVSPVQQTSLVSVSESQFQVAHQMFLPGDGPASCFGPGHTQACTCDDSLFARVQSWFQVELGSSTFVLGQGNATQMR